MKITEFTSVLLNRLRWAAMAGLSFGGKRKLYEVFGYPQALDFAQMFVKYQRQDLAVRVVDSAPEEMWAKPPVVTLKKSTEKWNAFVNRVSLWDRIIQADKLCAFGPFSILWIGLPGNQEKTAPPAQELDNFLYLQAYGGNNVEVKAYETNTNSPRYGRPTLYTVRVGPESSQLQKRVHYTRVIHIVDRPLQGLIFSEPRLAQVYNVLDDLLKVGGGAAETYWTTANRGMQVDIDKEMELDPDDAKDLNDELEEFQHQLRRFIRTRGVKINPLGAEVADPSGVFATLMSILAGATNIPQRILMGAEAGQLASEQDRANWAQYITRRRKVFGEPWVLKAILLHLEELQYIEKGEAESAAYEWPEAFATNPLEESQIRASDGRAVVNYARRNQFGNPIITDEEVRRRLGLSDKPPAGETLPSAPVKGGGQQPAQRSEGNGQKRRLPSEATSPDFAGDDQPPPSTNS